MSDVILVHVSTIAGKRGIDIYRKWYLSQCLVVFGWYGVTGWTS